MKLYNIINKLMLAALLFASMLPTNSTASDDALASLQQEVSQAAMAANEQLKNADASASAAAIEKVQNEIRKLDEALMAIELINTPFNDEKIKVAQKAVLMTPRDKTKVDAFLDQIEKVPEGQEVSKKIVLQHMQDFLMPTQLRYNNLQKAGASEDVLKVVKKELENTKKAIESLGGKSAKDAAEKNAQAFEMAVAKLKEQENASSEPSDEDESESDENKDRKSYSDYRAEQRQDRNALPVRTAAGALTGEGQLRALEQRQARETAQRVQNSILANNSLPTDSNRNEWVRLFVETYESPYVMSELSQEEKAQYMNVLNEFFQNAQDDINAENAALLYDKLSDRLHDAIKPRLVPYIESRMQAFGSELDEIKDQADMQAKKLAADEAALAANPGDVTLQANVEKSKAALEATQQKGYRLATKIAAGAAVVALFTVGGAAVYGWYTGQGTAAVLSSMSGYVTGSAPAQYIATSAPGKMIGSAVSTAAGYAGSAAKYATTSAPAKMIGSAASSTASAVKSGAQWAGNKAWNLGLGALGTAAMNKAAGWFGDGAATPSFSPEQYDRAVDGYSSSSAPIIDLEAAGRMVN